MVINEGADYRDDRAGRGQDHGGAGASGGSHSPDLGSKTGEELSNVSAENATLELERKIAAFTADIITLARETAPTLRQQAGSPPGVEYKKDGSVVTASDRWMEREFIALCEKHFGEELVFLGEETEELTPIELDAVTNAKLLAVCDPIDGTRNFVEGELWFGNCLGISERVGDEYVARFGVVIVPSEDTIYITKDGKAVAIGITSGEETLLEPKTFDPASSTIRVAAYGSAQERYESEAFADYEVSFEGKFASIADVLSVLRGDLDMASVHGKWWDVEGVFNVVKAAGLVPIGINDGLPHGNSRVSDFETDAGERRWYLKQRFLVAAKGLEDKLEPMNGAS